MTNPPPLYTHQKEALALARRRQRTDIAQFGLLMDPGTGKTRVVIQNAERLYEGGFINTLFVLAPNGVHSQWVDEQMVEHCSVPYRSIVWQSSRGLRWKSDAKEVLRRRSGLLIVTMNYEALITIDGQKFAKWLLKNRSCYLVADESSRIRSPKAIRTRIALQLAPLAHFRTIMTGTPIAKGFENLWSQFQFLNPAILNCPSFTLFRLKYCQTMKIDVRIKTKGGHDRVIHPSITTGYKNVPELMELIAPYVYIKKKEDCLDLPAKIYLHSPLAMTKSQAAAYKTMRDKLMVELADLEKITVAHMISARSKLRQIGIGFLLHEGKVVQQFPTERYDRLAEHIEEGGDKIIVWATFRPALAAIEERLKREKISYVRYQKGDSETRAQFMQDPSIRVFLANPASGGIGLNLAKATTMIFFNNTDDAEIRWQAEDRAHRIGQTKHLTIIDMFVPGTVESKMLEQQKRKENIAALLMKGKWRDLI